MARDLNDLAEPEIVAHHTPGGRGGKNDGLQLAELLVLWLDRRFADPLLGLLFPGFGDLVTSLIGLYMVGLARHRRLPPIVMARMLVNLSFDSILGAVPVFGDLFDVFYRSHARNLELLRRPPGASAHWSDWVLVGVAASLFVAALAAPIAVIIVIVRHLL